MRFLTGHKTRSERLSPLVELPLPKDSKELKWCRGMFSCCARWIKDYSVKIKPLTEKRVSFPLSAEAESSFESLLEELLQASLGCIDAQEPFTMKCNASDFALAAVLNQNGGPVTFMSRTFTPCKSRYPVIIGHQSSNQYSNEVTILASVYTVYGPTITGIHVQSNKSLKN